MGNVGRGRSGEFEGDLIQEHFMMMVDEEQGKPKEEQERRNFCGR